jgi:hypothetical protein
VIGAARLEADVKLRDPYGRLLAMFRSSDRPAPRHRQLDEAAIESR